MTDWESYRSKMLAFARQHSNGDEDAAEDATQNALLYLVESGKDRITESYLKQLVSNNLKMIARAEESRERAEAGFVDLHYAGQGEHPGEVRGSFQIKGPGE